MARRQYRTIPVKGHYRSYTIGGYPGPYTDVKKWIEPHTRKISKLTVITQSANVKRRFPYYETMTKEVPQNLLDAIKTLVKDQDHEYSIDLDFERRLDSPEQMLVMKGGKRETVKITDFEMFGHTHPGQKYPYPSNTDLRALKPLRPEFIVAHSGKAIVMNIEDFDKWKQYRNSDKYVALNWTETKRGRDFIFNNTGVRIYPFVKPLKIEVKDDPHPEKMFPRVSPSTVAKWHAPEE